MNENLRARLEAATTAAAEARLELAATKTQLEVATDAAAKARLAAKTDTDRDAALAEARDQRVVNERLRVELEAAKEAAAEARLAADGPRARRRSFRWGAIPTPSRVPIPDRDRDPPRTLAARFG